MEARTAKYREVAACRWPAQQEYRRVIETGSVGPEQRQDDFDISIPPFAGGLALSDTKSLVW